MIGFRHLILIGILFLTSVLEVAAQLKSFKDHKTCLYGLVNEKGDTIRSAVFTQIDRYGNLYFKAQQGAFEGLLSADKGEELVSLRYEALFPVYTTNYCIFKLNNKWGILSFRNGWEYAPIYERIEIGDAANNLLFLAWTDTTTLSVLDTNGSMIVFNEVTGADVDGIKDKIILEKEGELQALYHIDGTELFPFQRWELKARSNGHFSFSRLDSNCSGYLSNDNTLLFEAEGLEESYHYFGHAPLTYALYEINDSGKITYGVLDTGKVLQWFLAPVYDQVGIGLNQDIIYARKDGKYSMWRLSDGKKVLENVNFITGPIDERGILFIDQKRLYQFTSFDAPPVFLGKADACYRLEHNDYGTILFKYKNRWTVSWSSGTEFQIDADSIYPFSIYNDNGGSTYCIVGREGKYGIVDMDGEVVVPLDFVDFYPMFNSGVFRMMIDDSKSILLSPNGKTITAIDEEVRDLRGIDRLRGNYYRVGESDEFDSSFGVVHEDGRILIPPYYSRIEAIEGTYLALVQDHQGDSGIYFCGADSLRIPPGKYPIFDIDLEGRTFRYGYVDNLCIVTFDGAFLAEWQDIDALRWGSDAKYIAVDTFSVGIMEHHEPDEWLVSPRYCGVLEYSRARGLGSVRACPIQKLSWGKSRRSNRSKIPSLRQWGLVDASDNWVIPPISYFPIDLDQRDTFLLYTDSGRVLYNYRGTNLLGKEFRSIEKINYGLVSAYLVTTFRGKKGVMNAMGRVLVPIMFDEINDSAGVVFGLLMNENFDEIKVRSYRLGDSSLYKGGFVANELVPFCSYRVPQLEDGELRMALEQWVERKWFTEEFDLTEYYTRNRGGQAPVFSRSDLENLGYCHPKYSHNVFRDPGGYGTEVEYVDWEIYRSPYGIGLLESIKKCDTTTYTNWTPPCFRTQHLYNFRWHNGSLDLLGLWQLLDSSYKEPLIDWVLKGINQSGIEFNCARNGNYLYLLEESFLVSEDSISFYLPKPAYSGHRDSDEEFKDNYFVMTRRLGPWLRKEWRNRDWDKDP